MVRKAKILAEGSQQLWVWRTSSSLVATSPMLVASVPLNATGTTRKPRAGSSTSVMLSAQRPHSQKCAVWRSGFSSNGAAVSSLAATEIETTSNWNSRPSQNECKGA